MSVVLSANICVCVCVCVCVSIYKKITQLSLTLCDPMNCSPTGSSVHGIYQYWSGLPFPPAGVLPDPGIEPRPPALQAPSIMSEPPGKPCELGVLFLSFLSI